MRERHLWLVADVHRPPDEWRQMRHSVRSVVVHAVAGNEIVANVACVRTSNRIAFRDLLLIFVNCTPQILTRASVCSRAHKRQLRQMTSWGQVKGASSPGPPTKLGNAVSVASLCLNQIDPLGVPGIICIDCLLTDPHGTRYVKTQAHTIRMA
jgi:hypothetical protein